MLLGYLDYPHQHFHGIYIIYQKKEYETHACLLLTLIILECLLEGGKFP
jgi:hypothetical protein